MRMSVDRTTGSQSTRSFTLILLGLTLLTVTLAARTSNATSETQRFPQFENAHVKVWRSVIAPNAPLPPHRHDHGRVIIPLQGGTMKIVDQTGAAELHEWKQGTAYSLPANAPNTTHSDVNTGDHPIEVMVVEVEDDK